MKHKDIIEGQIYKLASIKRTNAGCSSKYLRKLINCDVFVIEKYNDFKCKNTVNIRGTVNNKIVSMWCSPYDLKEIKKDKRG